jgi:hypothetical protein
MCYRFVICMGILLAAPVQAETMLVCEGSGTLTNHSRDDSAGNSTTVDVRFDTKFDEAAGTLTARVPEVDYLRNIKTKNGVAAAQTVNFTPEEIKAQFRHEGISPLLAVASMGMAYLRSTKIPPLTINRLTGSFAWGPHSGTCSPVTAETRKF